MKRFIALALCLVLTLCFATSMVAFASEDKYIIDREEEWEYIEVENAGQNGLYDGWTTGEDSEEWMTAQAPFGLSSNGYVITPMSFDNFSCFMRKTFTIEDLDSVIGLAMNIIYDENPVVYINGTEVWSATGWKDADYNRVSLADQMSVLKEGENTIAVYFENSMGGAVCDLELIIPGTVNIDGSFAYKTVESYDAEGNVKHNPYGDIGAATNMFDMDGSTVWGYAFEEGMNVVVEFYDTIEIEYITIACKDEGSIAGDMSHGTYKIEALVDDEWVVVAESVDAYAADYFMDESNVYPESTITTNTIKVTITSWEQTLIDESKWAAIAEFAVFGASTTEDDVTPPAPTPDTTETPDATVTPAVTETPDSTDAPETTKAPETTTVSGTTIAPSTTPAEDDGGNFVVVIVVIAIVVVVAAAAVVIFLKKKKA